MRPLGGGPGRVCVRLQQDPAPTCPIPSRTSHPVLHQWLAQSQEARLQQTKQWSGQAAGCAALLGLPCRRSPGHLSAASLPPPNEAAALFEGRNGVTPTLSPPDNRGQHITRVLISPGPEAPCRSQTKLQTRASAPAFMMWAQIPLPNLNQSIGAREWPISHRHCLVHLHILSWEGLLAGLL